MPKRDLSRAVRKPGSETERARRSGRTLHEQAEVDSHSPNRRIRGKGQFALNAQAGKFGKRTRRTSRRRTSRG